MPTLLDNFDNDSLPASTCNTQLAPGRLPCDSYHHYYHYQSSAQYLWLAEACSMLGQKKEAVAAYDKALFQDHFNEAAMAGKERETRDGERGIRGFKYDKHPLLDGEFRMSIGEVPCAVSRLHDAGVRGSDIACFNAAIALDPSHSNSYFARGKYWFAEKSYDRACTDFREAIALSHIKHNDYHRLASGEHLARGKAFLNAGELDLAVNDFTKALDLWPQNQDAIQACEKARHLKQY